MASPIRLFPDPILRKPTRRVVDFDAKLQDLFKRLTRIMKSQPSGIGIAAPQIGVPLAVAVVDVSARVKGAQRHWLANPVIIKKKDERLSREGCMSLPNYLGDLKRYDQVWVQWQDQHGKKRTGHFFGIEAICFQHELDHLEGRLFLDHVASLKTDMIPRSYKTKRKSKSKRKR